MSSEEADIHEKFLGGTLRHEEHMEKDPATESSSSSDGSNEPHPNRPNSDQDLTQSATSALLRSQVAFRPSTANPPPFSIPQSQQAGNLLPHCTSATTSILYPPGAIVEASPQAGMFQPLSHQQDMDVSNPNQLCFFSQVPNHGSPFPMDQSMRISGNTCGSTSNNNYNLPTSNLPSDFRLESSSRSPVSQIPHPHSQILRTSGNGNNGSPFMRTQWSNRHPQHQITMHEPSSTTFGAQDFSYQGLLGPAIGSTNFRPSVDTHQMQLLNMPLQKRMESLPLQSDVTPTNSSGKMKMTWQDNIPPTSNLQPFDGSAQAQGSLGQNFSVLNASNIRTRYLRNTVYDPMYEAMGLPIDPHLRMLTIRRDNGDEEQ